MECKCFSFRCFTIKKIIVFKRIFKAFLFTLSRMCTPHFLTLSFCSSLQCQDYFKLTFQLMFLASRRLKSPNSAWSVLSFHFHSLPLSSRSCLTSHLSGIPGFGLLNRNKYSHSACNSQCSLWLWVLSFVSLGGFCIYTSSMA